MKELRWSILFLSRQTSNMVACQAIVIGNRSCLVLREINKGVQVSLQESEALCKFSFAERWVKISLLQRRQSGGVWRPHCRRRLRVGHRSKTKSQVSVLCFGIPFENRNHMLTIMYFIYYICISVLLMYKPSLETESIKPCSSIFVKISF